MSSRSPRAIWSGSISFGLVNVPVRMYSAIDEQDVHFQVHVEPRREAAAPDLMEALRSSLDDARGRGNGRRSAGDGDGDLADLTKRELERHAKREGVRGYSRMTKHELVDAIRSVA